jgi:hypothetical protein
MPRTYFAQMDIRRILPLKILSGCRAELKTEQREAKVLPLVLIGQVVLVALIGAAAFWLDETKLLGYIDGQYLLTLVRNQGEFASRGFALSSNPLQGLDDLWFFTNSLWMPELAIARLFASVDAQRAAIQCVACTEIFAGVAFASYQLGWTRARSAAAAWLAVILIEPLSYPSLIFNISPDAPELATVIFVPLLIVPLWAGIGTRSISHDAMRAAAITALLWFHLFAITLFAALSYPFLAVTTCSFLCAAWPNRREFRRKLLWGSIIVSALIISGLPAALWGIATDTAYSFFPDQLMRTARVWTDCSILLRPMEPTGVVVGALGIIGAVLHAIYGKGAPRTFAISLLICVALLLTAALLYRWGALNGSVPIYYEEVLWAVYPIFAICPLVGSCRAISRCFLPKLIDKTAAPRWTWVAAPLAAVLIVCGGNALRHIDIPRPNVFPPEPSSITNYLRTSIGLDRGEPFRGRVATMTGQGLRAGAGWEEAFTLDLEIIRLIGNDHRTIGLWYYNVPTLIEFSHTVSPLFYFVVANLLALPDDPQFRTLLHMRRPNISMLRLLGVRYVITDGAPILDTQQVGSLHLPREGGTLTLDEISAPDLGISPTKIKPLGSAQQALQWFEEPGRDFTQQALLAGPPPSSLVPAQNVEIFIERGGIRVHAESGGRSLVVIPFQFSNCLEAVAHSGTLTPELRRADLLLTGVLFDGRLDATIERRAPFFGGSYCFLHDRSEDRSLLFH